MSNPSVMRKDLHALRQKRLSPQKLARSQAQVSEREALLSRLRLDVDPQLPMAGAAAEISAAIAAHQVVVVAGETGSGKTTQLPKLCLQLGLGRTGLIGHTQPRRLAARTVANRIAQEIDSPQGEAVGFAMRFTDTVSPKSLIKVMTDGLLLTEIRRDRYLENYDVLIVDEAHERSLNIDFLLGYLRRLLGKRRDLKLVITSATIDVQRFSKFFGDAPVIEVSGRTFPVAVEYLQSREDLISDICLALEDIETRPYQGAADVLVFLSGEREILEVAHALRRQFAQRFDVLPLYARLSNNEQSKIFSTTGARRRVILATNVAETSVTVPNIGFVIDPGQARINRYSYKSKLERLPIEPISKASADQRKGRCGRVAPGLCLRLYEESDYLSRPEFTDPEIRRVNLASVVLQMQAYNLGEIQKFPFIDPPEPRAVKDAMRLLDELQALRGGKLTRIGRDMARMPVDPRLARMLVCAQQNGALDELLVIASALSVQDPRERPLQKAQAADQAHAMFADEQSDFLTLLNLWRWLENQRQELTNNQFKRLLSKRYLNFVRVREWREVHRQLRLICRELGYTEADAPAGYAAIHECVVAGSLSLIAQHDERGNYIGARNLRLRIFPGSGLTKSPKWIVAGEIAETTRVYARSVARIDAAWVERHAQHLVKSHYAEPHWSVKRGEVMARKSVSLYGLRLVENRLVSFASQDPALARDLFLRDGLVAGGLQPPPGFLQHNLQLVAHLQDLEARGRRRDILVGEDVIYAFYADLIPVEVVSAADLKAWLKRLQPDARQALFLDAQRLKKSSVADLTETAYPGSLQLDDLSLELKYRFAPGEIDDGVTVLVPIGLVPALNHELLEWSVPGFFPAVVEQWLRALPKSRRKHLAPLPDKVDAICDYLLEPSRYRLGRLLSALASLLADWHGINVAEAEWDRSRIEPHLLVNVRVVDADGTVLQQGRDLREIRAQLAGVQAQPSPRAQVQAIEQQALQALPAEGLNDFVLVGSKQAQVMKFPGLVDRGEQVDLQLFDSRQQRDAQQRHGLARLVLLQLGQVSRYFRKELDKFPQLGLHYATLGSAEDLKAELLVNVVWYTFFDGRPLPEDQAALQTRIDECRPALADVFNQTVALTAEIYALRFDCQRQLLALDSKAYTTSRDDVQTCLQDLVPGKVLSVTAWRFLPLLPRYLKGFQHRLEKLPGHVQTDLKRIEQIRPFDEQLAQLAATELYDPERGTELKMLLQELRLHLFAEPVARQKVSDHPLNHAFFGPQWKASVKRVDAEFKRELQRCGVM